MYLPFTTEQFFRVFAEYNQAVWPTQIILYVAAFLAVLLAVKRHSHSDEIINAILASFWLWMGVIYHAIYFSTVNQAAYIFGAFFILQALILIEAGVIKNMLRFRFRPDVFGITGAGLLVYALIIYPVAGYFLGHRYPASPTFGHPCPTTIFTFGMLLWADGRVPIRVILIPLTWSLMGLSAALTLTMTEDIGLIIAALVSSSMIVMRKRKSLAPQANFNVPA
jgi:hypothetical protein